MRQSLAKKRPPIYLEVIQRAPAPYYIPISPHFKSLCDAFNVAFTKRAQEELAMRVKRIIQESQQSDEELDVRTCKREDMQ